MERIFLRLIPEELARRGGESIRLAPHANVGYDDKTFVNFPTLKGLNLKTVFSKHNHNKYSASN
jgi:hypothetical protein